MKKLLLSSLIFTQTLLGNAPLTPEKTVAYAKRQYEKLESKSYKQMVAVKKLSDELTAAEKSFNLQQNNGLQKLEELAIELLQKLKTLHDVHSHEVAAHRLPLYTLVLLQTYPYVKDNSEALNTVCTTLEGAASDLHGEPFFAASLFDFAQQLKANNLVDPKAYPNLLNTFSHISGDARFKEDCHGAMQAIFQKIDDLQKKNV